jgi:histidyl-tRNA synthetase
MKKLNTKPLSGMQELNPLAQAKFDKLKDLIEQTYRLNGFQNIETPIIDRTEILLAKAGGDTEKQIYKVSKTANITGEPSQALRFDHTVPLARYVVEHENALTFPFRVTQIGRNFRGERAQSGRFREFYQCDADVIGRGTLPIAYDAEVIGLIYEIYKNLSLGDFQIRISNRKILSGLLFSLDLNAHAPAIFALIDKSEKISPENFTSSLQNLNIPSDSVLKITTFSKIKGDTQEVIAKLDEFRINNDTYQSGIDELSTVLDLLSQKGMSKNIIADLSIIRGLDYYTGTVFETTLKKYPQIGSVASGGRYDNLASNFSSTQFPGVGTSIGLTRLFSVLNQSASSLPPIDIAIIPISSASYKYSYDLSDALKAKNLSIDIIFAGNKLGDKLTHAAKIAKNAIIIGENELSSGNPLVKNLKTGKITPLDDYLRTITQ